MKTQVINSLRKASVLAVAVIFLVPTTFAQSRRKSTVEAQQTVKTRRVNNEKQHKQRVVYNKKKANKKGESVTYYKAKKYNKHNNSHVCVVTPKKHAVVRYKKLPPKAHRVYLDNQYYYLHNGNFYQSCTMGYYKVNGPKYVKRLPQGTQVVWVKGNKIHKYGAILFKKTPVGFKVIAS